MIYTQIVVPPGFWPKVLQEVHNNLGHFGAKKTLEYSFYWSGYEQDVESWMKLMKACEQFQKCNPPQPNLPELLGTLQAMAPFKILSWDIMGPLPTSTQDNKYVLVIMDIYTKWVEAFLLKDTTTITLATYWWKK